MPIKKAMKQVKKHVKSLTRFDRNLQKTNNNPHKVTYEVWNDRNLQTKQIKNTQVQAHFHFNKLWHMRFLVRFEEIKVETGLMWFLIVFEQKIW